ncbi:hypothetical protein WDW37_15820 [Bdellovibrionota bacterium FG-1]
MTARRSYPIRITVNGREIDEVVIDPHYEVNHAESINDDLILELVRLLAEKFYEATAEKDGFEYFVVDPLEYGGFNYRLVWLLEDEKLYVGVVNAFRR